MLKVWRMLGLFCLSLMGGAATDPGFVSPASAQDAALASDWTAGHKSRTRLTGGKSAAQLYAFVEIELAEGWKTYWRNPGDSGIPPRFEFGKSKNLGRAVVLYPAPKRIDDKGETIVGYTGTVVFPVRLTATDPAKPIELVADVQFGMCKDICVPTEAALTLTVAPDAPKELGEAAAGSLAGVPRAASALTSTDPILKHISTGLKSGDRKLVVSAAFPGGTAGADAFLLAPDGLYLPLLKTSAETGTNVTFEADISKDVDLEALAGKTISITLVSDAGSSEAAFTFE